MNIERYLACHWSEDYDCWTLVRDFYAHELGINLPVVDIDALNIRAVAREISTNDLRQTFELLENPVQGCIVEMGSATRPFHIGVYVDGSILHNHYLGGVVCEKSPPFQILGYYAARSTTP